MRENKHRVRKAGIVLVLGSILGSFQLVAAEATDAESKKILDEIAAIRSQLHGGITKNNDRAIQACQAALASKKATYDFYMASRKLVEFDEAGKRESDWREWRDRNEERLKSPEHLAALQVQLHYLILTLRASSAGEDHDLRKKLVPDLISYLDGLASAAENYSDHRHLLGEPVLASVVAQRLKLDLTVSLSGWSSTPGDVNGIYEQTILPVIRESKNLRALQAAWDKRIQHEGKISVALNGESAAPTENRPFRFGQRGNDREREREERREDARVKGEGQEQFREIRIPQLQWGKARDDLFFGSDRIAALQKMSAHLKSHLEHPDVQSWLSELEGLAGAASYDPEQFYKRETSDH